jgi:dihydroorotase
MRKASANTTWIRAGRVIDPANNRDSIGDVYVRDGIIVADLDANERSNAHIVDATGLVVAPGLVDIHVHLREPGQSHKESIRSGTRAGAAGGYTTLVCMPNTNPVCDNAGTIQLIRDKSIRDACIRLYPTGCLTLGMEGERLAPIGSLKNAGIVAVTDDGKCVQSNELMRRAVEYAAMFNLPVMDHCQDASLTQGAVMNEGEWSIRLGLRGWPKAAEDVIVARNVILADLTGAHIHMQHISSANAVDILRRAKFRGVPVTGEASPHHIDLTDERLAGYDTNFKMNPPLRSARDVAALIEGLKDGTIDCIATDHAPHSPTEKDVEFDYAPFGIIGLENALAVVLKALYHSGHCSLSEVIALMTHKGAEICRLNAGTLSLGAPADLVVFDPDSEWTVDPDRFQSKSRNCPWAGETLRGKVISTWVGGKCVFDGDKILESPTADLLA